MLRLRENNHFGDHGASAKGASLHPAILHQGEKLLCEY